MTTTQSEISKDFPDTIDLELERQRVAGLLAEHQEALGEMLATGADAGRRRDRASLVKLAEHRLGLIVHELADRTH